MVVPAHGVCDSASEAVVTGNMERQREWQASLGLCQTVDMRNTERQRVTRCMGGVICSACSSGTAYLLLSDGQRARKCSKSIIQVDFPYLASGVTVGWSCVLSKGTTNKGIRSSILTYILR